MQFMLLAWLLVAMLFPAGALARPDATTSAPAATATSGLFRTCDGSCFNQSDIATVTSIITCGVTLKCLCTDWETSLSSQCATCVLNYFNVSTQDLQSWCAASTTWSIAPTSTSTGSSSGAQSAKKPKLNKEAAFMLLATIAGGAALLL